MRVKTRALTGAALAWAVFVLEGRTSDMTQARNAFELCKQRGGVVRGHKPLFAPHLNWDQGGPIIEREKIDVARGNDIYFPSGNEKGDFYEPLWVASGKEIRQRIHGPTPLIAAMRCYVASKLGEEVDVPDELLTH